MTLITLSLISLVALTAVVAQGTREPRVRFINPPTLASPTGYSHVAEVRRGRTVYISGQVAQDTKGNLVGKGDMAAQATQVFENLRHAVEAAGGTMDDIVKITSYATDLSRLAEIREIRNRYFTKIPPASTFVKVAGLVREEWMLEIEAIAVIGE